MPRCLERVVVPGGAHGSSSWGERRWRRTILGECADIGAAWENIACMGKKERKKEEKRMRESGKNQVMEKSRNHEESIG